MKREGAGGTVADEVLDATVLDPVTADPPLARGAPLGRYVILELLGAGGMGVVYAAYDPELDRKVAVKLLRGDGSDGSSGRTRLLREAQAMARLADPNVIHVYDVGTIDDRVFVAMELVDGVTLRRWAVERAPDEILLMYLQAGRGLVAAHAAGLVHRDFKPDNVLVGSDGRARVLDFGLARVAEEPPTEAARRNASPTALTTPLTRTGAFLGTPAYMAPEQLAGESVDASSDQFSFSVALYEALYGERPFGGDTVDQLLENIRAGRVREPTRTLPPALRTALLRGLHADRTARHASMAELLERLRPRQRPRRWIWVAAALLVCAAGLGLRYTSARSQPCGGAEAKLVNVWDDARRSAIHGAFTASGRPFAEEAFRTVAATLDRYARTLVAMHVESCEATRVRGEQSEELLDLRMSCLADRRGELAALSDLFAHADSELVGQAVTAANALSGIELCANAAALRAPVRPPADAGLRARVETVRADQSRAKALLDAGRFKDGVAVQAPIERRAEALPYRPLQAEALVLLGKLQSGAGDLKSAEKSLTDGALAAGAARDAHLEAEGWMALVGTLTKAGRLEDARSWARHAFAALEGAGDDPRLQAHLLGRVGIIDFKQGKFDEAIAHHLQALAILEKAVDPADPIIGEPLNNLGIAYTEKGDLTHAQAVLERALALKEKSLGPTHPDLAKALVNLANVVDNEGHHEEALGYYQRALAIHEQVLGPEHADVANDLYNTAVALNSLGRPAQAEPQLRRALAINLKALGPDHPDVAITMATLSDTLHSQAKLPEALEWAQKSLAIDEKVLPPTHADLATPLTTLGAIYLDLGEPKKTLPLLERALAISLTSGAPPAQLGEIRFALARALWRTGGDRTRARTLAGDARGNMLAAAETRKAGDMDAWLKRPH